MNEPARIDSLLRQARAHEAPPELWAKIASRAQPTRGGGWRSAAALLLGAFAYALLAAAWRPAIGAPHDDVARAVAASWTYLGGADHEAAADPLLLQRLAQAATGSLR
jgi:hypothetical protein